MPLFTRFVDLFFRRSSTFIPLYLIKCRKSIIVYQERQIPCSFSLIAATFILPLIPYLIHATHQSWHSHAISLSLVFITAQHFDTYDDFFAILVFTTVIFWSSNAGELYKIVSNVMKRKGSPFSNNFVCNMKILGARPYFVSGQLVYQ